MQSRKRSIYESLLNIAVGLGLSVVINFGYMRYLGYDVSWNSMSWLAVIFTALSFARSYFIRRLFNLWDKTDGR